MPLTPTFASSNGTQTWDAATKLFANKDGGSGAIVDKEWQVAGNLEMVGWTMY